MGNMVRVRVTIRGTRPLFQHAFGPDSISLEDKERTGRAGNDPEEWKHSKLVADDGGLYVLDSYVFGMLRDAAKHTKKGRGSLQPFVAATLQVLDPVIPLGRRMPEGEPKYNAYSEPVYVDVRGAVNPTTRKRNVRYRLAAAPGWTCTFTLLWDKTVVAREVMRSVLNDGATLTGIGDGRSIGMGRFEVLKWEELTDAQQEAAPGSVGRDAAEGVGKGRRKVPRTVLPDGAADPAGNGAH